MQHSDQINDLTTALSQAQATFPAVARRGRNPHLGNSYSTLDDIIEAVRAPLAAHGLAFLQLLDSTDAGAALVTMLTHQSGQWIASATPIEAMEATRGTNAMQAYGSTLTYLRRYALTALLGLASDDDDDGNSSQARARSQRPAPAPAAAPTPAPTTPAPTTAAEALLGVPMGPEPTDAGEAGGYPTDSWSAFSDHALATFDHYKARMHLVNALKAAGIVEPWRTWSPEVARQCWAALLARQEVAR